jgi:hypothetical protein
MPSGIQITNVFSSLNFHISHSLSFSAPELQIETEKQQEQANAD